MDERDIRRFLENKVLEDKTWESSGNYISVDENDIGYLYKLK